MKRVLSIFAAILIASCTTTNVEKTTETKHHEKQVIKSDADSILEDLEAEARGEDLINENPINDLTWEKYLDKAVAEKIDLDLSVPQEYKGKLLWDTFANKPYIEQFSDMTAENWFVKSKRFQERLLLLAKEAKLDHESLRKGLASINIKESDNKARVPVGAFAARKGNDNVWIIVITWECSGFGNTLGHIEVIVIRMKDGKRVGYTTCG